VSELDLDKSGHQYESVFLTKQRARDSIEDMSVLKILLGVLAFSLLTVLTQIGGIVLLISLLIFRMLDKRIKRRWARVMGKVVSFLLLYLFFVFVLVPFTARPLGRVPLPLLEYKHVRPANIWTVLLNRNYVRPELRDVTYEVALKMNDKYPGTTINYLDANFPFIDKFPLPPHLSHNDGKKLDVSFHYMNKQTGERSSEVPSWLGYGVCEEPLPGEFDRPAECGRKGYWQYNFMSRTVSQKNKEKFPFDAKRTRDLVNFYVAHKSIGKILIEPHLKTRLRLTSNKVRLHGCNAVRHDDHIHVQLK
jgi:hypothetical protein